MFGRCLEGGCVCPYTTCGSWRAEIGASFFPSTPWDLRGPILIVSFGCDYSLVLEIVLQSNNT